MTRALAAIFAHPDDETFAAGVALARYAADGVTCALLCATDGGAGRSSDGVVRSPTELAQLRRAELHAAARVLGVSTVRTLGLPDGGVGGGDQDALVAEIVRFLRETRPQVVLTFGPEGAPNAHRDHRAISRATTAAFFLAGLPSACADQLADELTPYAPRRLYYASWAPPGPDDATAVHAVPLTAQLPGAAWNDTKRRAFEAHCTQHGLRDKFEALAMTAAEGYALAAGEAQPAAMVDDLFAGLATTIERG